MGTGGAPLPDPHGRVAEKVVDGHELGEGAGVGVGGLGREQGVSDSGVVSRRDFGEAGLAWAARAETSVLLKTFSEAQTAVPPWPM